jgi:hypothetical protein
MKRNIIVVNYPASDAVTISRLHDGTDEEILEMIFAQFNAGSGEECEEFLRRKLRSLSVNDFVSINGRWYQCMSMGWKKRNEAFVDKIEAAVVSHPSYIQHGEWFTLNDVMYQHRKESGEKMFE